MCFSIFNTALLFTLLCLLVHSNKGYANIAFINPDGIAMAWKFQNASNGNDCTMRSINASDPIIRKAVIDTKSRADFAIIVEQGDFWDANCNTKAKVNEAMVNLAQQLAQVGFPPIKLFILLESKRYSHIPIHSSFAYYFNQIFEDIFNSKSMLTMMLKGKDTTLANDIESRSYFIVRYAAKEDSSLWNIIVLSSYFMAYKWVYLALILVALFYASARIVKMALLKILRYDLFLLAFGFTAAYCISLLFHLKIDDALVPSDRYIPTHGLLSAISFGLILWHWATTSKNVFSLKAVTTLRATIVFGLTILSIIYAYQIFYYIFGLNSRYKHFNDVAFFTLPINYLTLYVSLAIWFTFSAIKLRRHPKGRSRFTQLAYFTAVISLTYILIAILYIIGCINYTVPTLIELTMVCFTSNTTYLLRALVYLMAFGISWPKPKKIKRPHLSLGPITDFEYEQALSTNDQTGYFANLHQQHCNDLSMLENRIKCKI
ncbi:hypothetical protein BDF19DRAFT_445034 [Syncephalis fuscata]|nr:hypothetical protein BDF19DRAFT_445034 [Syncephalis fuscata]